MRTILTLPDELAEELNTKVKELGLPSRNALIVQILRRFLGHPNVFEPKES